MHTPELRIGHAKKILNNTLFCKLYLWLREKTEIWGGYTFNHLVLTQGIISRHIVLKTSEMPSSYEIAQKAEVHNKYYVNVVQTVDYMINTNP